MSTNEEREEQLHRLDIDIKMAELEERRYLIERRKTLAVTEDQHNANVQAQAADEKTRRADEDAWLDVSRPAQLVEWASVAQHRRNIEEASQRHGVYLSRVAEAAERQATAWERMANAMEQIADKAGS